MDNPQRHLDSGQRHTLKRLSSHPLPRNVKWPEVLALLNAMGEVSGESNDRFRVTVDGRTEVFRPPHKHGDVPPDMVVKLRKFLALSSEATSDPPGGSALLVVVNFLEANVYEFEAPGGHVTTIVPYDPRGRLRHISHVEGHYEGQRTPEDPAYYRSIAAALEGAGTVVIFGHGHGHSAGAEPLRERLTEHLSGPAPRIIEDRIDAKSFTEPQLLAAARALVEKA
jgi:hypothetical protein